MRLSIVIPAFNEESRIGPTLEKVLEFVATREGGAEVIVVDDGSGDRTAATVDPFRERGVTLLRLPGNRGKGAAVRAGVSASRGDTVLLSDADLSTPIAELARLEPHLSAAPLVFGSRGLGDSRVVRRQPWYRQAMGRGFNLIIRALGVGGLSDTQCGFKLFDGKVARELFAEMTVDGFAFDVELVLRARQRGHAIAEVGVEWANADGSRVHPVWSSLGMLRDVVRLRWRLAVRGRPEPSTERGSA